MSQGPATRPRPSRFYVPPTPHQDQGDDLDFEITIIDLAGMSSEPDGSGDACGTARERSALRADLVTACSPAWLRYAVPLALRGEVPRTRAFVLPVLTGGASWDLGRGPRSRPMAFGGAASADDECDPVDVRALPEHDALAPRRRSIRVEEVLLDEVFALRWPAWRGVPDKGSA